jgi:hypothetical protein
MSNELPSQCEMCGGPIMGHTRGPEAKYCGSKCRKTASRKCVTKRAISQKRHRAKGKQKSSKIVVQNHELACHEFRDSKPSKVDLRAAPINILGGYRFSDASRLPADLRAYIFDTEIGRGPKGGPVIDDTPNYTAETVDLNPEWLDSIHPRPLPPVVETVSTPRPPVMSPAVIALLEDDGHPSGIPAFLRRVAI